MSDPAEPGAAPERSLVLLGIAALALVSPLRLLWARDGAPWWLAFAVMLALALLAAAAASRPRRGR